MEKNQIMEENKIIRINNIKKNKIMEENMEENQIILIVIIIINMKDYQDIKNFTN